MYTTIQKFSPLLRRLVRVLENEGQFKGGGVLEYRENVFKKFFRPNQNTVEIQNKNNL